jgi:Ca-activated chloride channel family protein
MAVTPWNEHTRLVQVGLQGYLPDAEKRAPANLVFLVDVSGSMNTENKLPLLKKAFRLLVNKLNEQDKITMVVYAGSSGVVLETTRGDQKGSILAALDKLSAGGSTHGSAGINLAYAMAEQAFIKEGVNRVILATDGDFNVGTVSHDALIDLIEQKKSQGIALTTLGFGSGNYNDHLMEQLADHGDGNYAYIDSLNEARKVLVEQVSSTLETIARDVKIQIEWNPALVSEYRLIGYENRLLNREDFNNDKVDAGDIGAGHNVTALYEITLSNSEQSRIEPLRYRLKKSRQESSLKPSELAFVKLRYKKPEGKKSRLIEQALYLQDIKSSPSEASDSLRFAASVAAFGELLRGGESLSGFTYSDVLKLARQAKGQDTHGYRAEFIQLVEMTDLLDSRG